LKNQRQVLAPLAKLAQVAVGLASPAIIVVGDVVVSPQSRRAGGGEGA